MSSITESCMKPLADALLAYSYKVKSYDEKTMVLQAGNGTEVVFEKLQANPVTVSLSADEGNEWAVRQVADILMGHPAFNFIHDSNEDIPWKIQIKGSAAESMEAVRSALLTETPAAKKMWYVVIDDEGPWLAEDPDAGGEVVFSSEDKNEAEQRLGVEAARWDFEEEEDEED